MREEWLIYILCDPRIGDAVTRIRYVGSTQNTALRLRQHLKKPPRACPRTEWIKALRPLRPILEVVDTASADWEDVEREWIRRYRQMGCDLFNVTDGGLGGVGNCAKPGNGVRLVSTGYWSARAYIDGARRSLGHYPTREEAIAVRDRAIADPDYAKEILALAPTRKRRAPHKIHRANQHGYRGVRIDKYGSAYARIQWNGRSVDIGPFKTIEEAARAYDAKAREFWGAEAILNFP